MTTIVLPPEIEEPLAEEVRRRGTTPELLAIDYLRERFAQSSADVETAETATLYDFLAGFVGTIDGTSDATSLWIVTFTSTGWWMARL
ncbi:MAG: hypothetical protein AB7R89_17745 [Dehalococcoidia bacterium]